MSKYTVLFLAVNVKYVLLCYKPSGKAAEYKHQF